MRNTKREAIENWVRRHFRISFSRSSGPGGQNVNKLNTKVTAWVRISSMDIFGDRERAAIESRLSSRLNRNGELVIRVQDTRSQAQNSDLAVRRITDLIVDATKKRRKRLMTHPTLRSMEERIKSKKLVGKKKRLRGRVFDDETGRSG
jgi:ribosome-associated protein